MRPALREGFAPDLDAALLLIEVGAVLHLRPQMVSVEGEVNRGLEMAAPPRVDDSSRPRFRGAEGVSAGIPSGVPGPTPGDTFCIDGAEAATAPEFQRAHVGPNVIKVLDDPFPVAFLPQLLYLTVLHPLHIDPPVIPEIRVNLGFRDDPRNGVGDRPVGP